MALLPQPEKGAVGFSGGGWFQTRPCEMVRMPCTAGLSEKLSFGSPAASAAAVVHSRLAWCLPADKAQGEDGDVVGLHCACGKLLDRSDHLLHRSFSGNERTGTERLYQSGA